MPVLCASVPLQNFAFSHVYIIIPHEFHMKMFMCKNKTWNHVKLHILTCGWFFHIFTCKNKTCHLKLHWQFFPHSDLKRGIIFIVHNSTLVSICDFWTWDVFPKGCLSNTVYCQGQRSQKWKPSLLCLHKLGTKTVGYRFKMNNSGRTVLSL